MMDEKKLKISDEEIEEEISQVRKKTADVIIGQK